MKFDRKKPMVFCIGLPKTGTTSLHHALKILGYRSIHWPRAHLKPRKGWINYFKKSGFDAFSDAPINDRGFYEELEKEFPDAKFILTIRKPESLAKSWDNYFKYSPWKIETQEDKEKIIQNIKDHNKEVKEYFKNKSSKLLIFDILKGDGWEKLCSFLDKQVPEESFPHSRKGRYKK
jgi:hypothetical protein